MIVDHSAKPADRADIGRPIEEQVIAAEQLNSRAEESIDAARVRIAELIHTAPLLEHRVA